MKALIIYNPYNTQEVALLDRARQEVGALVQSVEAVDFQEVKNLYPITQTPAVIFIRDDLQGQFLFSEDEDKTLRIATEVRKEQEEEETNLNIPGTNRIDGLISAQAGEKAAQFTEKLLAETEKLKSQMEATASAVDFILMNFTPAG